MKGTGDINDPHLEAIDDSLSLVPGDLGLSGFEDELSSQWGACLDGKERAFRVISAFWQIMPRAAKPHEADLVLVDLGPNLGAIIRAGLIASTCVVIPFVAGPVLVAGASQPGPNLPALAGRMG
ncbi:MAG: hypothetical protein KIT09_13085 [Bryobacteraceae bacterium]|nr:hypothetical protein [Bryobacteraceae bacterium]